MNQLLSDCTVEVLVFVVPLSAESYLATLRKCLVDRIKILVAPYLPNPSLGWSVDWVVLEIQANSVPSLSHFGFGFCRHIKVIVNPRDDRNVSCKIH